MGQRLDRHERPGRPREAVSDDPRIIRGPIGEIRGGSVLRSTDIDPIEPIDYCPHCEGEGQIISHLTATLLDCPECGGGGEGPKTRQAQEDEALQGPTEQDFDTGCDPGDEIDAITERASWPEAP